MKAPIIAFGHQSRVGKDECGKAIRRAIMEAYAIIQPGPLLHLLEKNGIDDVKHVACATEIKEVSYGLFSPWGLQPGHYYEAGSPGEAFRDVILPDLGLTPVEIWIKVGKSMAGICEEVWAHHALKHAKPYRMLVLSDARRPVELLGVQVRGGWCVRVDKPSAPPPKELDREVTSDFVWDRVIVNDGSLQDLHRKAVGLLFEYLEAAPWRPR